MSVPNRTAIKRLASDVKNIMNDPLDAHGIYYKHDDENILKGYAMLVGPENTPYNYGYYLFEFNFPSDYPYRPPVLTFHTNGDRIRMNPNLYRSGKVCISILNTWKGEQWSSCQTIRTVLLTLITILNDKPLTNEPGYKETDKDFNHYNEIIYYKNIDISILRVIDKCEQYIITKHFISIMKELFVKNYENIIKLVDEKKEKSPKSYKTSVYDMYVPIYYDKLKNEIKMLYDKIKV